MYRQDGALLFQSFSCQGDLINFKSSFEGQVTKLYLEILIYQAQVVCQLSRNGVVQHVRNMFKADDWDILAIQKLESGCEAFLRVIDSGRLESGFKEQNRQMEDLLRSQEEKFKDLQQAADEILTVFKNVGDEQKNWRTIDEENKCHQTLRTSKYEEHKARNPDRVPGTCKWFLGNQKFRNWRDDEKSSLLWVSADPGCGKSVLSKSLIENELSASKARSICYFFFKDDSKEQKTVTKALCALLHQLFEQKQVLLREALEKFRTHGEALTESFLTLWAILIKAAENPEAGEIICVLDALDECEEAGKEALIDVLNEYYTRLKHHDGKLKFLITSRPYSDIERRFGDLTIRLAGEDETEIIQSEIDMVIKARVPSLAASLKLDGETQDYLEQRLLEIKNRTYLWLYLILDGIKKTIMINTSKRVDRFISEIPNSVYEAYEAILRKSPDPQKARKVIHIVLAATRPLTLQEMNVAINVEKDTKSYKDLDLDPEEKFGSDIKNLCGLFVSVIDNKIYLIHQSAKEFLIFQEKASPCIPCTLSDHGFQKEWKHSFENAESHMVLTKICIFFLSLDEFEYQPLDIIDDTTDYYNSIVNKSYVQYIAKYLFLDYSAHYWPGHFRNVREDERLLKIKSRICDTQSSRFMTWFHIFWRSTYSYHEYPKDFTNLMLHSYMGSEMAVKLLLQDRSELKQKDHTDLSSSLSLAAGEGHEVVVQLLLQRYAIVDLRDEKYTRALSYAARFGYETIVKMLLERNINPNPKGVGVVPLLEAVKGGYEDVANTLLDYDANPNAIDQGGKTALAYACLNRDEKIVRMLLARGIDVNIQDNNGTTALMVAANYGNDNVVKLLLEHNVDVNIQDNNGTTALMKAVVYDNGNAVKLLLEHNVDVNIQDNNGTTALMKAVVHDNGNAVKLLLEHNVDVHIQDNNGTTALMVAANYGNDNVVKLLLEHNVDVNIQDNNGRTALMKAVVHDNDNVVKLLLEHNVDVNIQDNNGTTALMVAANYGNDNVVKLLLEHNVDVNIQDNNGTTALMKAVVYDNGNAVKLLLEHNVDVNIQDNNGTTALMKAVVHDNGNAVKLLLEHNVDVNIQDNNGRTALMEAVIIHDNDNVVKLLLEHNADPNIRNEYGVTLLLAAVKRENETIAKLLLRHGADRNAITPGTLSPTQQRILEAL